jgi:hypothetical protein
MPKVHKNTGAAETLPKQWLLTDLWRSDRNSFEDGKGYSFYGRHQACQFIGPETDTELTPVKVRSVRDPKGRVTKYSRRVAQERYNACMSRNEHPPIFRLDEKDHR